LHNLPSSSRSDWGIRILFLLLVAGITGFFLWQVSPEVLQGQLDGPDAYMRLVRVTRLVETGGWYDSAIPRSNAPFGETLHWTRPLDVLLLVGATLLRPFFSFPHALFWAGVFLSPVLLLFIGNLAAWASEPLAGREYRHLATIAVLTQVGVLQTTLPGRPDHHALHLLIFFLTLGAALRWVMEPFSARTSFLAGSWVGMGLWVGTEFLVPLGLLLGCGLFFWIRDGGEHAEKNRWFSLGLAAVLLLALLLEQPLSRLLVAELDKISIPHATLGILAVLFWTLLGKGFGNPQGMSQRRSRLLSALAAGLVAQNGGRGRVAAGPPRLCPERFPWLLDLHCPGAVRFCRPRLCVPSCGFLAIDRADLLLLLEQ